MGRTIAILDVPRRELAEKSLSRRKKATDIVCATGGSNMVYQWAGTGSWTLQPLNMVSSFSECPWFETLKLRLSDFKHDSTLWTETPERHDANGPFDYFYSVGIPASQVPQGYPHTGGSGLLQAVGNIGGVSPPSLRQTPAFDNTSTVQVLTSQKTFDYNTGFCIRFYLEGRSSFERGAALAFQFGEFFLALNTSGTADLYQTADFITFTRVYTWHWSDQAQVHDVHHRILIVPHARNKIEFISGNQYPQTSNLIQGNVGGFEGRAGAGLYEVPGELVHDSTNDRYIITAEAPCAIYCSQEFRPYVQISTIAYANGNTVNNSAGHAFLIDAPYNIGWPPQGQFRAGLEADLNGCDLEIGLYDPVSQQNWSGGNGYQQIQAGITFVGKGDIAVTNGVGPYSSMTPELYGYSLRKDPVFRYINRIPVYLEPKSVNLIRGETMDSERCTLTFDNSNGQLAAFWNRTHTPVMLYDADTNVIFFEGTAAIKGTASIQESYTMTLECRGMAADLVRAHFTDWASDYGHDPDDSQGRSWYWMQAALDVIETAGIERTRVVIEIPDGGTSLNQYNFRLPNFLPASGPDAKSDDKGDRGSGHVKADANKGTRWQPKWDSTPYDFLNYLLRGYLHWEFVYSTEDRCLHIFKRPLPTDAGYAEQEPDAYFFGTQAKALVYQASNPDASVYTYSRFRFDNVQPTCTSVVVTAMLSESNLKSKAELQQTLQDAANGNIDGTAYTTSMRQVAVTLNNYQGWPNPLNRLGYANNPDYLGVQRMRLLPTQAPNRSALSWIALRAFWEHCFGQLKATIDGDWGDDTTTYFRKWSLIAIDSGRDSSGVPNGTLEWWWVLDYQPMWSSDANRRSGYNLVKWRPDCPPPF